VFFVEALHPFEVLTAAGFEVDLASETGTCAFDDISLTPPFLSGSEHAILNNPKRPFMGKIKSQLKKASDLKKEDYPGIGEGLPEHAKPFCSDRRQQGLLVRKMPIQRASGDPKPLAQHPHRYMAHAMRLDGAKGLIEKRAAQVPAMVWFSGLFPRSRMGGTCHIKKFYTMVLTVSTLDVMLMLTLFTLEEKTPC
jgi:hypothetical protein